MKLTKAIREKEDAPLADLPFGLRIRARAWTKGATVNVVRGHDANATLLGHEAAHAIRDQDNDEMHHPAWHLCGLVGHAIRLFPRGLVCRAFTEREVLAGKVLATIDAGVPREV